MAIIRQTHSSGRPRRSRNKDVNVNSYNVDPDVILATASGTLFEGNLGDYDFFKISRTSADTDSLILPASLKLGSQLLLFAETNFELGSESSSGVGINGGNDTETISVAQGSILNVVKSNDSNWIAAETGEDGSSSGGGGGGLANLEDSGSNVQNTVSGTGAFIWNAFRLEVLEGEPTFTNTAAGKMTIIASNGDLDLTAGGGNDVVLRSHTAYSQDRSGDYTSLSVPDKTYVDAGDASDPDLKDNIKDLESTLEFVNKTNPKRFDWKDNVHSTLKGSDIGFTTSQFREDFPELVVKDFKVNEEVFERLLYKKAVPILWKAVQELSKELEELKSKI